MTSERNDHTIYYGSAEMEQEKPSVRDVLEQVMKALDEKGYSPMDQLAGYLISGDPAFITSHAGARSLIRKLERDEIIEELLKTYLNK